MDSIDINDLEFARDVLKSQLQVYKDQVTELQEALKRESEKVVRLTEELANERNVFRAMQLQVQQDKNEITVRKIQDIEFLSQLRVRLNEYVNVNETLYNTLENLTRNNSESSTEEKIMADVDIQNVENAPTSDELEVLNKIEKQRKNEIQMKSRKSESENSETNDAFNAVMEKNANLLKSLQLADSANDELEEKCRKLRALYKAKHKECELQSKIIKKMTEAEEMRLKKTKTKCKCIDYDETLTAKEAELAAMFSSVLNEELKYEQAIGILKKHNETIRDVELEIYSQDLEKMLETRQKTRQILALATENIHNHQTSL